MSRSIASPRRRSLLALPGARPLVALASLPTLVGCYATVPLDPGALRPGERVEITLTGRGTDDMARLLGPGVARAEGHVSRLTSDTVSLLLVRTERHDGRDDLWQRQSIAFPRALVATARQRRLSRPRTWLLAGGALAAALVAGAGFARGGGAVAGDGGGAGVPH